MARTAGRLGPSGSWVVVGGLVSAALVRPFACSGDPNGDAVNATLADLLADFGPEVVVPALDRAREQTTVLADEVAAWSAAVEGGGDAEAALAEARAAWFAAMTAWQEVELLQLGPAASSLTAVAGADLRDEIYSWPSVNRCRVDQVTVFGGWDAPDFFTANLIHVYGLDALEVLLFSPATENGCPPQVDINAQGIWDTLTEAEIATRRASYGVVVARGIADRVEELRQAWDPAGGDFGAALARAGDRGSPYESPEEALNAVFDALFYLETMTKDRKLGRPLGLRDCLGDACLGEVESPLAGGSHRWVQVDLAAFRTAWLGGDGVGMDDLLRDLGHGDVADAMVAALDEADAKAAALTVPIEVAAGEDPATAVAVHDAVVGVTDLLKGDVVTLLALQIPQEAAGDND